MPGPATTLTWRGMSHVRERYVLNNSERCLHVEISAAMKIDRLLRNLSTRRRTETGRKEEKRIDCCILK